jgi:hypothetical protein
MSKENKKEKSNIVIGSLKQLISCLTAKKQLYKQETQPEISLRLFATFG